MHLRRLLRNTLLLSRYNMKIIFANKFIWFVLASLGFFGFFMVHSVLQAEVMGEGLIYGLMIFPAFLLIFYPTVYGIQNDDDMRILEILFGIPNYRYKVWLTRLMMIYVIVFVLLLFFGLIASFLLYPVNPAEMAGQLFFPLLFMGNLAFYLSTQIRSGNGTAVVMVILGVFMIILGDFLRNTMWDVMLNPFETPQNIHALIWEQTIVKNRMFLVIGSIVFLLFGLLNLQKREKFV